MDDGADALGHGLYPRASADVGEFFYFVDSALLVLIDDCLVKDAAERL